GEDYVAATRVMGARTSWILAKHVARNCAAPVLVFTTVLVADAIVLEASLSFIQAGVPDPEPSWGNVIAAGRDLVMGGYWWATFFPGLALMLTVLCLNLLPEGMTDAMVAAPRATRATPAKAAATDPTAVAVSAELTAMDADEPVETADEARLVESEPVVQDVEPEVEHVGRAIPLAERLAVLRGTESARSDRHAYTGDAQPLLEVRNLSIRFPARHGDVAVVDDVSFSVRPGETMALVGESGCGKSITSLAVMGLLDASAQISGEILYGGKNLLAMGNRERASLRGTDIAMIYQDALSSLNPPMLIRAQTKQPTRRGGTRTAEELLELVRPNPRPPAPARAHRHGAHARPEAHHRGRADDGPRRHRPGPGRRAARRAAREARLRDGLRQPRPRARRGDRAPHHGHVRGPGRRAGAHGRAARRPAPRGHAGPAGRGAVDRPTLDAAAPDPRHRPVAARPPDRRPRRAGLAAAP